MWSIKSERSVIQYFICKCRKASGYVPFHTVGHDVWNRVVGVNFPWWGETVSQYFNHIVYAIGELRAN